MTQRRTDSPRSPERRNIRPVSLTAEEIVRRLEISQFQQMLACSSAMLTVLSVGIIYGWSMIFLNCIASSGTGNALLKIKLDEYSWITSLFVLGSIIGSFMSAELADHFGRKSCLLLCSIVITTGWFITVFATSGEILYIARVLHGIGAGMARTINPMYVTEIADIKYTGKLGTLIAVTTHAGTLLASGLSYWMNSKFVMVIFMLVSFISFFSNMCFPETPYFLVAKGRKKEAYRSLAFYRGIIDPNEARTEIRAIRAQTRYELHPQSRYELDQQSRTDLPSPSRSNLPSPSRSNLPSPSRSDLPSQSRRNLSPQSTHGQLSGPTQQVGTGRMSDLHSPPSSHAPATSGVRSEVVHAVVHQQTRGESRQQAPRNTLELDVQHGRASYSRATSDLQSRTRRDLHSQSNVDSRAAADMNEIHMDGNKFRGFTKLKVILQRSNKKALFIMFGLIVANQFGGDFIIMQCPEKLHKKINIIKNSHEAIFAVHLINMLCSICVMRKVDFLERKSLLTLSTLGSTATMTVLSCYFFLAEKKMQGHFFDMILPIVVMIYIVTFQIGLGTILTVLLCEFFPTELRGYVGATIVLFDGIIALSASKLYQLIDDNFGTYWVYSLFGSLCCLGFLIILLPLPETKGKTYNEIRALLDGTNLHSPNEEAAINESGIRRL